MPLPDPEQLLASLAERIRPHLAPDTVVVGVHTGGVWMAEKLCPLLGIADPPGSIDVGFYRDDFAERGLPRDAQSSRMPADIEGRPLLLFDDVLYTGRTIRAAMNEIFDYGRPSRIDLAVLLDRGGRELPIDARWSAASVELAPDRRAKLAREASGRLYWRE